MSKNCINTNKFAVIGGTYRCYCLIQALIEKKHIPEFVTIMKEDEHENEKYSKDISAVVKKRKIPYTIKKKLGPEDYKKIQSSKLDFILVYGWRTLIDMEVNKHVKLGFIAAHQSLLPKYRGFAPLQWAMINGETETGVTIFLLNDGEPDSGKIISQKRIQIFPDDYARDLDNKIIKSTIELFLDFFEKYNSNSLIFMIQDEYQATYSCKRTPADGKIDWSKTSTEIHNLIRAISYPFTGAFCYYNESAFNIRKATLGNFNNRKYSGKIPGRVVNIDSTGIEVLCGEGSIKILEWEDKKLKKISNPNSLIKSVAATLK